MIWFSCSKCGKTMSRTETSAGALVFCDCGQGNTVPWESTASAPAEPLPAAPAPLLPPPLRPVPVGEEKFPLARPAPSSARPGDSQPSSAEDKPPRDGTVCFNHSDRPSLQQCAACQENFCADCLVQFKGQALCGPCKNFRLRDTPPPSTVCGKAVLGVMLAMLFAPLVLCGVPFSGSGSSVAMFVGALALLGQLLAMLLGTVALIETDKNPLLSGRSLAITTLLTAGLAMLVTVCFMLLGPR